VIGGRFVWKWRRLVMTTGRSGRLGRTVVSAMRWFLFVVVSVVLSFACSGSNESSGGPAASAGDAGGSNSSIHDEDAGDAGTTDAGASDAPSGDSAIAVSGSTSEAGARPGNLSVTVTGAITSIAASTGSSGALTPAFAAAIDDYYVRCAAGTNAVTITVSADASTTVTLDMVEDQAVVVGGQYWIRCLPHDFPTLTVTTHPEAGAPTPGWILLNSGTYGMALDTNGTPVWYTRGTSVIDVDTLAPDALSFMPNATAPFGYGATAFTVDGLSQGTARILTAVGSSTDDHDLRLLPNGDYLLLTYPFVSGVDLTGLQSFGAGETMADCEIQEVGPTGSLVWSWRATDHIDPVRESLEPDTNVISGQTIVDPYHCNSLDVDASGNVLLSTRHTNALFYIDRTTGKVVWKLGGTEYNKDGAASIQITGDPETAFNLQHDGRFLANGDVSVFDDHGATSGVARGVEYALDHDAGVATVAWQYLGVAPSTAEGSCRRDADGETVIGWGINAIDARALTEVNAAGTDVLDVAFTPNAASYRAVKVPLSQLDANPLRNATAQ
jgi:hypothetical protein